MNFTNYSTEFDYQRKELNLYYAICEIIVALFAVIGNALVIFVFQKERRLRRRTNYYIVSLAVADLLVGLLGIPFAIMSSIGLPTNLHACLFTVSLLVVLCTISILCLVAVSVDRYWAILHPMGYSRNVRTKTAIVIITICWMTGTVIGFLPLMGWHRTVPTYGECFFLDVMDYNYLVFLYFGTIITPALLLLAFYAHIYQVVLKQLRRVITINPKTGTLSKRYTTGGTMLRVLGADKKREVKATQNLAIIVLFFMICWIPLYTINCILAFCSNCHVDSTFMFFCIILSHINSAGNPFLYAYHLRDFRIALKHFFCNLMGRSESEIMYGQRTFRSRNNIKLFKTHINEAIKISDEKNSTAPQMHYQKSSVSNVSIFDVRTAATITKIEINSDLWNINEDSPELNDYLKQEILPTTRYKQYDIDDVSYNTEIYGKYSNTVTYNGAVYFKNSILLHKPKYKSELELNLLDHIQRELKIITPTRSLTNLSSHFSRNEFFVEDDFNKSQFSECDSVGMNNIRVEYKTSGLKDCRQANSLPKIQNMNARRLGRSLSDEGTRSKNFNDV